MFRAGRLTLLLTITATMWAAAQTPGPRLSAEGRFLYADDDDWDWATPANANVPSRLSIYGRMPWSALDWMEEGLDEVRGVLVGTPPASGGYLTMSDLNKIRSAGPRRSYEQITHTPNILSNLLQDKKPPNLIMDIGTSQPPITSKDVAAGLEFVRRGGRLIILDDWQYYQALAAPFLDKKKFSKKPLPAPTAKQRHEVEEMVRLLGAADFKVREKARADLLKLGPAIVPILMAAKSASLEEKARVRQILKVLDPMPKAPERNAWLTEAVQTAKSIHQHCEIKTISRNGNQAPGTALCIRLPQEAKKGN